MPSELWAGDLIRRKILSITRSNLPRSDLEKNLEHLMVQTKGMFRNYGKLENIYKRRYPGFNSITFTFSENSNIWQESLLEVIRRNIDG